MYRLLVQENGQDRAVDLEATVIEIGRGQENQVVIKDPRSSRKHCRLSRTAQGWVLEDLKSRNGTLLNGTRVERNFLKSGDEFRIGEARFRLQEEEDARTTKALGAADLHADSTVGGDTAERETAELPVRAGAPPPTEAHPARPAVREASRGNGDGDGEGDGDGRRGLGGFSLEGLEGTLAGKRIEVTRLPFRLGRKAGNDLLVEDPRASSRHAEIVERGGRYLIRDLESRNGTVVNKRRVKEAVLGQGAVVMVGDSTFRVHLPPGAVLPGEGPPGEEPSAVLAGEEDEFAGFDARRFLEGSGRQESPLAVVAVLLVLGTVLYFAVDLTLRVVRPPDPDPASPENLLSNWSLEARREAGSIPGWVLHEGDQGTIAVGQEGVQYPGRSALLVTPQGEGLCRAASASDLRVEENAEYRVSAQVKNRGALAAGVLVSWLGETEGRKVEIARDWGQAIRLENQSKRLERALIPPHGAVFARVCAYAIASEGLRGGAAFDQLSFSPAVPVAAPAGGGEEGAEEEGPLLLEVMPESKGQAGAVMSPLVSPQGDGGGPSLNLEVEMDGSLRRLKRGERTLIHGLWASLSPVQDPLLLGHRLQATCREAASRDEVLFSAQIPDLKAGSWRSLEIRVAPQRDEVRLEYRLGGNGAEGGEPDRLAVALWCAPTVKSAVGFGGDRLRQSSFSVERAPGEAMEEIIFGSGAEQLALLFSSPVRLRTVPHPEAAGRNLLLAEATLAGAGGEERGARVLSVRLSPFSRRENEAVAAMLAQAEETHREGKAPEARALLRDLRSRFPWRQGDLSRAEEIEKGWDAEAERALKEIEAGLDDLRTSPSPVIRDALLTRAGSLAERFRGSPSESRLRAAAEEAAKLLPTGAREAPAPDARQLLQKVREHLDREELGFSLLWLREARRMPLGADEQKTAEHLQGLIEERRRQAASRERR